MGKERKNNSGIECIGGSSVGGNGKKGEERGGAIKSVRQ